MLQKLHIPIVLLLLPLTLISQEIIDIRSINENTHVGPSQVSIFVDESNALTVEEVVNKEFKVPTEAPWIEKPSATYWVKFIIQGNIDSDKNWVLESYEVHADKFELYRTDSKGKFYASTVNSDMPLSTREYDHFNLVFDIDAKFSGTKVYYIKIKDEWALSLLFNIRSTRYFTSYAVAEYLCLGLYYGILIFVLIYNLMVFINTREKLYLYYVGFVLASILYSLWADAIGLQYLWPDHSFLGDYIDTFSRVLILVCFCFYSFHFFRMDQDDAKMKKYIQWSILTFLPVCFIKYYVKSEAVYQFFYFLPFLLIYIAALRSARRKFKPAYPFLIGYSIFIIAIGISIMREFGLYAYASDKPVLTIFLVYILYFGTVFENVFFSFGLAQRLYFLKKENEDANQKIIEQLKINENLKDKINQELENKVRERTKEIANKNRIITHQNLELTASIQYAKTIQEATLPNISGMQKNLKDLFVFYQPRDVVSGDFYWFNADENHITIVVADCTGHGVPGAFMSMIGSASLTHIIAEKKIRDAEKILNELNHEVIQALQQHDSTNNDGMDVAICTIDKKNNLLHFASANLSLLYMKDGELIEISGDRQPIGGLQFDAQRNFTAYSLSTLDVTSFYLFTDGYYNQLGGSRGKKLSTKTFQEKLQQNSSKPMSAQYLELQQQLKEWRGKEEQTDDVLVIGIKL